MKKARNPESWKKKKCSVCGKKKNKLHRCSGKKRGGKK